MSLEEQIELLKTAVSYYAYNTHDYDYGYAARQALLILASKTTTDGEFHEAREL